jgi:hypothetical protein
MLTVAQNDTRLEEPTAQDPVSADVSLPLRCSYYFSAGVPVDLHTLGERLGSEAIILASGLSGVLALSTIAEQKSMSTHAKEHTNDSLSTFAYR